MEQRSRGVEQGEGREGKRRREMDEERRWSVGERRGEERRGEMKRH